MGRAPRVAVGGLYCGPIYLLDAGGAVLPAVLALKEPIAGFVLFVVGAQKIQKQWAQNSMPVALALAVLYEYIAVIAADVLHAQPYHLANAEPGSINGVQDGPVLYVGGLVDYLAHFFRAQHIGKVLAL